MIHELLIRDITPMIARNIVRVSQVTQLEVDPQILQMANFETDPALALKQFITDHNSRCVIPFQRKNEVMVRDTIAEIVCEEIEQDRRVIILDTLFHWKSRIPNIAPYKQGSEPLCQITSIIEPSQMVLDRHATLILHITHTYKISAFRPLGRMFKKIIIISQSDLIECSNILDPVMSNYSEKTYALRGIYEHTNSQRRNNIIK